MFKKIIFATAMIFSLNSYAGDMGLYETELKIDAVGENASQAREKALADAHRKAVYAITERITDGSATAILDNLNDNQILNFIQQVSVISEKVVDSRYLADLKITINAPVLKAYLAEKDITITNLPEAHVFIIPVYKTAETASPLLWEAENLWYQIWEQNSMNTGQITIKPLPKNKDNQKALLADEAIRLNGLSLDSVRRLNDNADLYVAEATTLGNTLNITLKSPLYGTIYSKSYEETDSQHFENAVKDIKSAIINQIQQKDQIQQTTQSNLTIVYSFNALKEWVEVRKQIVTLPSVKKMDIDAMSGKRIQMTIQYNGNLDDLLSAFAKNGLLLIESGSYYTLERK